MKTIDVVQGSPEWLAARLGIPTASGFDQIITAKRLEPSDQSAGYLAQLAAEWFLRTSLDDAHSDFMERGTQMEPEAARFYAFETDRDVTEVGFCLTDDGLAGASPDRLVGTDGLLEIKVPSAKVHMGYLLAGGTEKYTMQMQGQLWVTGREWCDFLSYHPTIPPLIRRYARDPKVMRVLDCEIPAFCARLEAAKAKLAKDRPEPAEVMVMVGDGDHEF